MITGIGVWLCAARLMTITAIEQRAVFRGRRTRPGSWLVQRRAQIRYMQRFTWVFFGIAAVSIATRTLAMGDFVFLPVHAWAIVDGCRSGWRSCKWTAPRSGRSGRNQERAVAGLLGLSGVPQLSVFGSPSPRAPVVIVVGGLPEDSQIIGPFATPALATRFARRQCQGDCTIAPLHP